MGLTFLHNFIMVNMLCNRLKNKRNILGVGLTGSRVMKPIETTHYYYLLVGFVDRESGDETH